MRPPRKRFGNKKRTAAQRKAALMLKLYRCTPEMLPTFTPEELARLHGVPANDCAAMLEEARGRRS